MPKVNMSQCERQAVAHIMRQAIEPELARLLRPTDTRRRTNKPLHPTSADGRPRDWLARPQVAGDRLDAATASRQVPLVGGGSFARISEAEREARFAAMLAAYERLTGFRETPPRVSLEADHRFRSKLIIQ